MLFEEQWYTAVVRVAAAGAVAAVAVVLVDVLGAFAGLSPRNSNLAREELVTQGGGRYY